MKGMRQHGARVIARCPISSAPAAGRGTATSLNRCSIESDRGPADYLYAATPIEAIALQSQADAVPSWCGSRSGGEMRSRVFIGLVVTACAAGAASPLAARGRGQAPAVPLYPTEAAVKSSPDAQQHVGESAVDRWRGA